MSKNAPIIAPKDPPEPAAAAGAEPLTWRQRHDLILQKNADRAAALRARHEEEKKDLQAQRANRKKARRLAKDKARKPAKPAAAQD